VGVGVRPVGVGVRPVAVLAAEVQGLVARFDPELVGARDCLDLVGVLSDLERSVSAGLALAARRVAQTNLWERNGHRSAAHWLAATTKTSVGDAVRLLETAEVAVKAPQTMEALRAGELSTRQAHAIGKAEAADPDAGAELVKRATENTHVSVREIEQDSARIVHAASGETEAEKAEKIRRNRSFRAGSNGDGSSWAHIYGPTAELARLDAAIKPILNDIFQDAREQARRESRDAYAFDALMALTDRRTPARPADTANRDAGDIDRGDGNRSRSRTSRPGRAGRSGRARGAFDAGKDRWRFAEVIFRVDFAAYQRGELAPGEVCEIAGHGPVPLTTIADAVDGGAFVAALSMNGTQIDKVIHHGRRPTALQRTALKWDTGGTCVVEGCTNAVRLEHEHVKDWAATKITRLRDLAAPCKGCHDLKTYKGYRFGPRLPNGKRRLVPPRHPDHAPPDGTVPPDDPPGIRSPPAADDGPPAQGDLFDTG
jgi:hypothetical protein